jgi:hypothetical protein
MVPLRGAKVVCTRNPTSTKMKALLRRPLTRKKEEGKKNNPPPPKPKKIRRKRRTNFHPYTNPETIKSSRTPEFEVLNPETEKHSHPGLGIRGTTMVKSLSRKKTMPSMSRSSPSWCARPELQLMMWDRTCHQDVHFCTGRACQKVTASTC